MSDPRAIPFSVLDLASIGTKRSATETLRNSRELVVRAEQLGYTRYWLAEHHNMPGIASSSPPVLIGHLADATNRIRIGSGGVMLPNHPPLVVAEQFGLLEALHPGRIDLGIGRAPGTDPATAAALRRAADPLSVEDFPKQLNELMRYFDDVPGAIQAVPAAGNRPPLWLLGSSGYSARAAAALGLPFAFAHHFSAANTLPALRLYRENFRPSEALAEPYAMVAAAVICAEDAAHARWIAGPGGLSFLRLRQGKPGQLPTPEEAAAYPYTDVEASFVADRLNSQVIGDLDTVGEGLADLAERTMADEMMITTMVHDPSDRLHSYELLAQLPAFAGARAVTGASV
ncbi:MAG: LLM class flavin-dependent oxidoreductase [Sciscionella sp.]